MSFTGKPYCIKQGDNLWDIANKELGDPYAWSSIYAFNNMQEVIATGATKIRDPDIIYAGHQLNLPIFQGAVPKPTSRSGQKLNGSLKDQLPNLPPLPMSIVFKLPDTPIGTYSVGTAMVTVRLKGEVLMSSKKAMPIRKIINGGYQAASTAMAGKAIGMLLGKQSISFDGKDKFEFSNQMTIAAGGDICPTTSVTLGVNSLGKPITKFELKYPELRGTISNYNFATASFKVEAEVELKNENPNQGPNVPIPIPIYSTPGVPAFKISPEVAKVAITVGATIYVVAEIVASIVGRLAVPIIVPPGFYYEQELQIEELEA